MRLIQLSASETLVRPLLCHTPLRMVEVTRAGPAGSRFQDPGWQSTT